MHATWINRCKPALCALVAAGIALISRPAAAVVYDLRAAGTTVVMADGTPVPMWGFGLSTEPDVSVPGPVLDVPPGDGTLTVNLTNELDVPISIVIPALPAPATPVWDDGTTGPRTGLQQRVFSFTHVTQPGETVAYQWTGVPPGTYLYHSGTHPAVQVPMGLYGAVRHDAAAGEAYGAAYDQDAVLVYGEVDPTLNAAVANGTYGTAAYPTTVGYRPRYFLINGQPAGSAPALPADVQGRLLLRLVNAGLRSVVPTLAAGTMTLLAEDGHASPFAREAYSMLLAAGQTRDALLVPTAPGTTVLFDRRGAGELLRLTAAMPPGAPAALGDDYTVAEDGALDTALAALPGVLANDAGAGLTAVLDSGPSAGALALAPDGSFLYAPSADFHGVDTFRYHATDGALESNTVTVVITVTPVNDAPVAADDAYTAPLAPGEALAVPAPGVLANDADVDLDTLSAQLVAGPTGGTLALAPDGSFLYTPDPGTAQDSFTYQASDGALVSAFATVTLTITAPVNAPPVAEDDFATTPRNTAVVIDVAANDADPDGDLDPTTVTVASQPTRGGTVTSPGDGTVQFTPRHNFKGTDTFTYTIADDLGAVSAPATVHVNVTRSN